ncbi:hypothetical protein ACIA5D_36705 [Actinoplanes sp. NPDC051513]|uniref:hypothetical protein n=1 Tax=Actinoplanes sp. NPDC051513 TaxID=3363908 RepID=UPI0037935EEE
MTTKTFTPRQSGPIAVDLSGYNSNIEAATDPGLTSARIELVTAANSGPTIEMLENLSADDEGDYYTLHLPKNETAGSVIVGSGNVVVGGSNFSSISVGGGMVMTGGGDADMYVNCQRIQVRGGRTYVNGVAVDGGQGGDVTDPPMPVHIRAFLPPGSSLIANTYNGDVASRDVASVRAKSYNGDVTATGLASDSEAESYNGDVTVGSAGLGRPTVHASTYNGDVRLLDENMRARPQTRNGRVRYPN